jgi:hypothetical protein
MRLAQIRNGAGEPVHGHVVSRFLGDKLEMKRSVLPTHLPVLSE